MDSDTLADAPMKKEKLPMPLSPYVKFRLACFLAGLIVGFMVFNTDDFHVAREEASLLTQEMFSYVRCL